ncbi:putative Hydroxylase/desaturase asaB [Seiridium cardinale]|uniref:Hydroxylase/desaturase asaB n=1 Tax=Seiridium cardinale TaxID=138064 RepID=A0ABR2Y7P2_9PEZI
MYDNLGAELAFKSEKTRWAMINLWRPIETIRREPLALCDARSTRDEDLVPVSIELPPKGRGNHDGVSGTDLISISIYYKQHSPNEKWYYFEEMTPEEVLFVKIFDTIKDGKTARNSPHSAFDYSGNPGNLMRKSIEVRTLVFWEDQPIEG